MKTRGRPWTARLVVRLYLPVMLSVIIIGLLLSILGYLAHESRMEQLRSEGGSEARARLAAAVASMIAAERGDPAAMERLAEGLDRHTRIDLAVFGADGEPWAELGRWSQEPLEAAEVERLRLEGTLQLGDPPRIAVAVMEGDALVAYGVESPPPDRGRRWRGGPPWFFPGLGRPPYWVPGPVLWTTVAALILLAIVSVFFTRSVARPLSRLSEVARALGQGDLSARARLRRDDELGDVGAAFDEMAERVEALLQAQAELLAGASHELRTPLSRIRVALDIAAEGDAELAREQLLEITEDLQELETLVADILILARLDLQRSHGDGPHSLLRLEPTAMATIIDDAMERFSGEWPDRQVELHVSKDLPPVEVDGVLVVRVVTNLLENAAKYSESADAIALRARQEQGAVLVEVEDQGIGIDAEDLEQVFVPFFRSDRSRTRATGGVGLGLSLVRRIVEAHGGSISARSEPDQGSTFSFTIPTAS